MRFYIVLDGVCQPGLISVSMYRGKRQALLARCCCCSVLRGEGLLAMRSIHLLAGALAVFCGETAEAVSFTHQTSVPTTPAFVIGFGSTTAAVTRKRPRGCCSATAAAMSAWIGPARPVSAVAVPMAPAGSFTPRSGGRGVWFRASTGERSRQYSCGEL